MHEQNPGKRHRPGDDCAPLAVAARKRLPGTPDIVMRKYGIVIFIHGCFWHGHEGHLHLPQTNADFWRTKIERNKARDARQKEELLAMGWSVLTVWECQLKPSQREHTLATIEYYINASYLRLKGQRPAALFSPGDLPGRQDADQDIPVAAEPEAAYGSNVDDE